MNRKSFVPVALCIVVLVSGCGGRSPKLERDLVALAEDYTRDLAAGDYASCLNVLTGDALNAMLALKPVLEGIKMETKILEFHGRVDFLNRTRDRASVVCRYLQEQTIEGVGTFSQESEVVYEMKKVGDSWKIYSSRLVSSSGGEKR